MKNEEEVKVKFDHLYFKELEKKREKYLTQGFKNCKFNGVHKVKQNGKIGFCHNPLVVSATKKFMFVCNEDKTACNCEHYECRHTEESVREGFLEELKNPSVCGQKYPKMGILLWFLHNMPEPAKEKTDSRGVRFLKAFFRIFQSLSQFIFFRWW